MAKTFALVDTGQARIHLADIKAYANSYPRLWTYLRGGGDIYRIRQSRKDLDVIIAYRKPRRAWQFCKHKDLVCKKDLYLWALDLRRIADKAGKATLVIIDPRWEGELVYEDYFILEFVTHQSTHS